MKYIGIFLHLLYKDCSGSASLSVIGHGIPLGAYCTCRINNEL